MDDTLQRIRNMQIFLAQKEFQIRDYFLSLNMDTVDPEILEIINYFKKYRFSVFPYEFPRKYYASDIDVFFDNTTATQYVLHENKRLYFPEEWLTDNIRIYYNSLRIEQDKDSPHRYETDGFVVQEGDVIADVGAAEGIWALTCAERAGKIYLFENNRQWIKALKQTLKPWEDKVIIVDKSVSNIHGGENVTFDEFFGSKRIDFIKADVEGAEIKLLEGCKDILANNNKLKLLLCAYHAEDDEKRIKKILEESGFKTECSKGYMLFIYDFGLKEPYVRRGLVRAMKNV